MQFNYFLRSKTTLTTPIVVLTFDDGPDEHFTPKILDVLKKYEISAVFFVIGSKVKNQVKLTQRIVEEGHLIGNHTYSHHPLFSMQNQLKVEKEIGECDNIVLKLTGKKPTLFRAPIGYTNPIIARAIKKLEKQSIGWTLRSYDSVFKNPMTLKNRLLSNIKNGQIVLLHDNLPQTAEMLEEFILEAQKNGIIFANQSSILKEFK